jgi:hypothetical protein
MRLFLIIVSCSVLVAAASQAKDVIPVGRFSETGLEGWTVKRFQGETAYRIVEDGGHKVLEAHSEAAASGLVFETEYDPREFPILTWSWKVANTVSKGDSRTKAGDDYAARVYVVFPHWFFPKTRTLNYIWANRLPREAVQANAFTGNAMMIAVESGSGKVGEWVTERRDIVADYRRAFGEEPPLVGAIAIMTDTDNTGTAAMAWYGDITASRR